jgi:type IV pilus assembly protein PilB
MLGDRLLASGTITAVQLQAALEEQGTTGDLLGEVLMRLSFIGDEALSNALAQEAGVPFITISGTWADPALVALVPESFARRHLMVPLRFHDAAIEVLQANPFDVLAIDEVQRVAGHPARVVCGTRSDVLRLIDRSYGGGASETGPDVIRLLDKLLDDAIGRSATDLHIEPERSRIRLRCRVDGVLMPGDELPMEWLPLLISRIKAVSDLDQAEQQLPQDGRFVHETNGRVVGVRVSTLPTMYGEKIALHLLERSTLVRGIEELGFSRRNLARVRDVLNKPRGVVLLTGPAGAGKTTSLYSALAHLSCPEKNILTVEDSIECEIQGIRQTQVRPRAGFTFATAVQSVLRQDPDVIMISEIRDLDTGQLALRAGLSGVLVFTTLPTMDATSAVLRLIDLGLEPYLVASGLLAVIAQRLVRVVCSECKTPVTHGSDILAKVGLTPDPGFVLYQGRGCERCGATGCRGRTGVFEVLTVDPGMQALIRQRADVSLLRSAAIEAGMKTLFDDALSKAIFGQTTIEEVLRVARSVED